MVKLTIIGRVNDGMPLAQGLIGCVNANSFSCYKQQGEFLLKEVSRGALPSSKMTIWVDHHICFNYSVENEVCYITLCDSFYPRKLIFHYLQDLQKEFGKFDNDFILKISTQYSFLEFDTVIRNISKQYIDTRTEANLSKLKADRGHDLDIVSEPMSEILKRRRNSETSERTILATPHTANPIWGSQNLEIIAVKWAPITIIVVVLIVITCAGLIFADDDRFIIPGM